jgi:4-hydroxythreonine-4-phosphate dehydrogenase
LLSSASLLIVADDVTGAADCAARCRHAGLPATIAVQAPRLPLPPGALAFTTDSRHLDPAHAAQRVRTMVGALVGVTNAVWYKKIDSTLRGNLGSELDALLDTLGHPCALVCPAFPAHGRGLLDGRLTGAPLQPVHLPTLLAHQSQRPVAALPLAAVRAGSECLAAHVAEMRAGPAQVLVVDALSEDDLHTIVAAAAQALPDALLCGSGGLIGALAARQAVATRAQATGEAVCGPRRPPAGPALVVVGSGSAMAHAQIAHLRRQGVQTIAVGAETAWQGTGDVLLHLPEPSSPEGRSALEGPAAREAAARLAEAALAAIARRQPAVVVLVGGDTAISVLARLGIQRLTVLRELLPGMPLAWGVDAAGVSHFVIMKAGSHGDETTLATLVARARSEMESEVSNDER